MHALTLRAIETARAVERHASDVLFAIYDCKSKGICAHDITDVQIARIKHARDKLAVCIKEAYDTEKDV